MLSAILTTLTMLSAPQSPEELAELLAQANRDGRRLGREFQISLEHLNRVLQYTPDDLTISVEAGVTLGAINATLATHKQWLPIGAPRPDSVTVAQAVMENDSGPFRLFYGSLRDMVIGVRFVTADGKLVKSGGQVVKNVAGYDLGKLLIGSRGTLALLTQVNFRLFPRPAFTETIAFGFESLDAALGARTAIQKSPLTPLAMDLLDTAAAHTASAQELPPGDWVLVVAYGGVERVIERYRRDLQQIARHAGMQASGLQSSATLTGGEEERLWNAITGLPAHMEEHTPSVTRIRVASTIGNIGACIAAVSADAVVSRAGTGITYFYRHAANVANVEQVRGALDGIAESVVVEYPRQPMILEGLMLRVKQALDPNGVLGEM